MGRYDTLTREQLEDKLYFLECLQYGMEYQDFLTIQLKKKGINLNNFCSKKYQTAYGENLMGIEIKHDKGIKEFGNVYIETSAISKNGSSMVDGGITYQDNDRFYLIGDETECYIFKKDRLKSLLNAIECDTEKYRNIGIVIKSHTDKFTGKITSTGIVIPKKILKHFYYRHYEFEDTDNENKK